MPARNIRKALLDDVKDIAALVADFAKKGDMLPRPLTEIYSTIRDFVVYVEDGVILGVCALHISWEYMAEVRSLAVDASVASKGVGAELVARCLEDARPLGVKQVFALTYKPEFFEKLGFKQVDKEILPQKIWSDCVKCMKFPNCDENAVIIELREVDEDG
jgi:amino-acid N-acetyltransferase